MCNNKEACCKALVEGAEISLCRNCSKFGKVIKEIKIEFPAKKAKKLGIDAPASLPKREKIVIESIISGFGAKIKKAREKSGLTQQEFALKISEKESIVRKLETEFMTPNIDLARKLEKLLHITLVEQIEEGDDEEMPPGKKESGEGLTLGDFIKK
jgi:putative transcription factor